MTPRAVTRREQNQEATLRRLQQLIPSACPLVVTRRAPGATLGGFAVRLLGSDTVGYSGRFEVVAAWIRGYLAAWKDRP